MVVIHLDMYKFVLSILLCAALFTCKKTEPIPERQPLELIDYWNTQRKGANFFNEQPTKAWFLAAAEANIRCIRFVYDKWKTEEGEFLIGNADHYTGLVAEDVERLRSYLDLADSLGIKAVLAPLSLPGARYFQNNNFKRDLRLWQEEKFQTQAAAFWQDMAEAFAGHPALVGYTLLNEPCPEKLFGIHDPWGHDFKVYYDSIKGTPADLNRFNQRMVQAIRKVDTETPIVLESGLFATTETFDYFEPIADDKLLYAFHFYEPYGYTTRRINKGEITYPGKIFVENLGQDLTLDRRLLDTLLQPVRNWAERTGVPANRIFASEFGADRKSPGVVDYFRDLIGLLNKEGWHWSFYAFREDSWESMDYELGVEKPFYKYWDYQEAGTGSDHYKEVYGKVKDQALWSVFSDQF